MNDAFPWQMARVADVDIQKQQEQAEHLPHDAEGPEGQDHMVSLDAVKKSLSAPVQSTPLQGYLLKRSENVSSTASSPADA